MNTAIRRYKKIAFQDDLQTNLENLAELWGCSLPHLVTQILQAHVDGTSYPLHPRYAAERKEREREQKAAAQHLQRQQARIDRQTFAAESVVYRRAVGRPGLVPPPDQKIMDYAWKYGKDLLTLPVTGVELWDFVRMFCYDRSPAKSRKGPRPVPLPSEDPRGLLAARAWKATGNIELIRKAPDGTEIATMWAPETAPPVGVMLDPQSDPWANRLTPSWYSQQTFEL
jgi:hypothetical protein